MIRLDALAFSLSGLPAKETSAAALAYTLFDLHRPNACLDYPKGGMGAISSALIDVINKTGSKVFLKHPVKFISLDSSHDNKVVGLTLHDKDNTFVKTKRGVLCTANVWALPSLIKQGLTESNSLTEEQQSYLNRLNQTRETKSFLHLHLGLNAKNLPRSTYQPHYTILSKGLHGDGIDPCSDRNMVAVSNPSMLDSSLTDSPEHIIMHAYGAGNEPYDLWQGLDRSSPAYKQKKAEACEYLYDSVAVALGIDTKEVKERSDVALLGTPLTHQRFLNRFKGTYGSEWRDVLDSGGTPFKGLYLAGDSVFPGIGVPAVAVSGASAANSMVSIFQHLLETSFKKN